MKGLLALAVLVGCGDVANPAGDAGGSSGGGTDGGGGGSSVPPADPLTGSLRTGCVLALHMEEDKWTGATGEVKDSCGSNAGTMIGVGTTTVANGVRGRAGSFSGGGCVDIPNAASLHGTTGLTMSAWIYPTQLDGGVHNANGVISKRTDADTQEEYSLSVWLGDNVYVDLDGQSDRFGGMAIISTRTWAQLTVVYDGTRTAAQRARVYINGSIDITKTETSASLTAYTSTLHIGCMPAPTASPPTQQNFVGQLDEVVVWNRALTEAEITQWYNNTKP